MSKKISSALLGSVLMMTSVIAKADTQFAYCFGQNSENNTMYFTKVFELDDSKLYFASHDFAAYVQARIDSTAQGADFRCILHFDTRQDAETRINREAATWKRDFDYSMDFTTWTP